MHEELKLDNQVCFRLYTAARLVMQAYTPLLTQLGITYPQYLVLMVLWERMEKQGFVTRERGKQDKRQHIVSLTEKGKALEQQAYDTVPDGMKKSLALCPMLTDDYQQLAGELDNIIESLR